MALLVWVLLGICALLALAAVYGLIYGSPFSYPYFTYSFDVSNKRKPDIEDYLDEFLVSGGFDQVKSHRRYVEQWKQDSLRRVNKSAFRKLRLKQYQGTLDDRAAYRFCFVRSRTRYTQSNYVRTAHKVDVVDSRYAYSFADLQDRFYVLSGLAGSDVESRQAAKARHVKRERGKATRKLREQIMARDNYTCQVCGKYMPDEVGLQVDHIVPVSRGGRTEPSNLRVLCSKCNGAKSDKLSEPDVPPGTGTAVRAMAGTPVSYGKSRLSAIAEGFPARRNEPERRFPARDR